MAKKSKVKVKIKLSRRAAIAVLLLLVVLVVAFMLCYMFIDGFKKTVDGFFKKLTGEQETVYNTPRGDNELRLHFLDVGQGDCILIELPDDTVMLIDSGEKKNETAAYICEYINQLKISRIDYLMATHSDSDHIGNMVAILNAFEVEKAFIPDIENTSITQMYAAFVAALEKETYGDGSKCEIVNSKQFDLIESERAEDLFFMAFLSPNEDDYAALNKSDSASNKNGVSPIILLNYMNKDVVLTGDVIEKVEKRVVGNYNAGLYRTFANKYSESDADKFYGVDLAEVDLLKVAHHGGDTSSCAEFLNLLKPKLSVISVGAGNKHGHPHTNVLERLNDVGTVVYRTDLKGTIVATIVPDESEEIKITFESEIKTAAASYRVEYAELYAVCVRKKRFNEFLAA